MNSNWLKGIADLTTAILLLSISQTAIVNPALAQAGTMDANTLERALNERCSDANLGIEALAKIAGPYVWQNRVTDAIAPATCQIQTSLEQLALQKNECAMGILIQAYGESTTLEQLGETAVPEVIQNMSHKFERSKQQILSKNCGQYWMGLIEKGVYDNQCTVQHLSPTIGQEALVLKALASFNNARRAWPDLEAEPNEDGSPVIDNRMTLKQYLDASRANFQSQIDECTSSETTQIVIPN